MIKLLVCVHAHTHTHLCISLTLFPFGLITEKDVHWIDLWMSNFPVSFVVWSIKLTFGNYTLTNSSKAAGVALNTTKKLLSHFLFNILKYAIAFLKLWQKQILSNQINEIGETTTQNQHLLIGYIKWVSLIIRKIH